MQHGTAQFNPSTGKVVVGDRIVGEIRRRVFTSFRSDGHVFRGGMATVQQAKRAEVAAWGIDVDILRLLQKLGVRTTIIIHNAKGRQTTARSRRFFKVLVTDWETKGYAKNLGYGLQYFLKFDQFFVEDRYHTPLKPWA